MMLRRRWWLLAGGLLLAPRAVCAAHVNVIELDNQIISPVTQHYIVTALERSEGDGAECLIIVLDTPGGLLESTRAIVKRIMNAEVPVVVYVGPSGARAGSAGVFITLASHIAAMAPSTNIGAAHPVSAEGGGPVKKLIRRIKRGSDQSRGGDDDEEEVVEEESKDPMSEKVINDTVAWIATIARSRNRNDAWARRAVTESVSADEQEAARLRIVDFIAKDLDELRARIDGWPVETRSRSVTLATRTAEVRHITMTPRQRFLAVITHPSIAYLLMLLGTLGLIFEFTHPGIGFPGIAGLMCVILALYAFQTLPINYAALALMGLGLVLLVAEVKIVSYGLLTLGGVIALTLGSLMLVEAPDPALRISLQVILPTVATLTALVLFILRRAFRAHRQRVVTGAESMIGATGTASTDVAPHGQVFVHGELWQATSPTPIRQGEPVRVVARQGLQLTVEKV